jgi:signal transduction histidine kinase
MVAGALLLVLCGAIVWIRMLHRQVEDRTRLLKQEITEHEMTELRLAEETKLLQREIEEHRRTESSLAEKTGLLEREIEERKRVEAEVEKVHKKLLSASRLAGMADVATNVLHNVGNVLNSVNVLSASITTQVQRSKMPGVARLAELLSRHRENLASFVTEDENGKHVPAHLERLGAHLDDEQAGLLEKAKALNESVQHAKEIVAMQQNYAKVAGVLETVSIAELVEDALRMCTGALARHEIEVERDFEATPTVTLDRHKVLQILFNLLDNAKHACESAECKEGKVTVRTRQVGANRVRIQVADNGAGISAAHLEQIFTQGFSTRKGGHGFGLHSSILAAQDMGGSLTVESAGAGMGATFTLELPVMPQNTVGPIERQQPMLKT